MPDGNRKCLGTYFLKSHCRNMVKSGIKNNLSVFIPIGNTSEKIQQISSWHYSPLLVICKIVFVLVRTEISKHFLSSTNFVNKKKTIRLCSLWFPLSLKGVIIWHINGQIKMCCLLLLRKDVSPPPLSMCRTI